MAFGIIMLTSVIYTMNGFYTTTYDMSAEIGMKDTVKTINTAMLKVYLETRYFNADDSVIYLKLPLKIAGDKYRIAYNSTKKAFCYDQNHCYNSYLLDERVQINASVDSSADVHYVKYSNGNILVN